MNNGILVTLEGNEGSGKSTQIKLLCSFLKRSGRKVFLTREPGGTRVGDAIRGVLLDNKNKGMSPVCETLLYMASRAELIREVILPKLKEGNIVLCDRWMDATIAYQGYGGGVSVDWIKELGHAATQGVRPKLSLYLDLPLEAGLRRAKSHKKADRMERKALSFHKKVRQGFLCIAKSEPGRFKRIKIAEHDSIDAVQKEIRKAVFRVI